jgi:hypothetical protein
VKRLLDIILGRTQPPPARADNLLAIASAAVTMQAQLGLMPGDQAGLVFRPVESPYFDRAEKEVEELLAVSAKETGSAYRTFRDQYGYRWVVLQDPQFEDLVSIVQMAAATFIEQGFGEQLLAAVFRFTTSEGRPFYWLYQFKRGAFSPFAPIPGSQQRRDHALELRLANAMRRELPVEKELEYWYPLWDIPF